MSEKNVNSVRTLAMCKVIFKSNRIFRAGGKNFFFHLLHTYIKSGSVFPPKPENPIFDTPPNITIYTHIYQVKIRSYNPAFSAKVLSEL